MNYWGRDLRPIGTSKNHAPFSLMLLLHSENSPWTRRRKKSHRTIKNTESDNRAIFI